MVIDRKLMEVDKVEEFERRFELKILEMSAKGTCAQRDGNGIELGIKWIL